MFTVKQRVGTTHFGYSCVSWAYRAYGELPSNDPRSAPHDPLHEKRGPLITLFDDRGVKHILPIEAGGEVYVANDRGKTVDHYLGDQWRTKAQWIADGFVMVDGD